MTDRRYDPFQRELNGLPYEDVLDALAITPVVHEVELSGGELAANPDTVVVGVSFSSPYVEQIQPAAVAPVVTISAPDVAADNKYITSAVGITDSVTWESTSYPVDDVGIDDTAETAFTHGRDVPGVGPSAVPAAWWRLDDPFAPADPQPGDATYPLNPVGAGVVWNQPALYPGGGPSVQITNDLLQETSPNPPFLTGRFFTMAVWVKEDTSTTSYISWETDDWDSVYVYVVGYDSGLYVYGEGDGYVEDFYLEGPALNDGVAHSVIVVADTTLASLYIDGILVDSVARLGVAWTWNPVEDGYTRLRAGTGKTVQFSDFYFLDEPMSTAQIAAYSQYGPTQVLPPLGVNILDTVAWEILEPAISLPSIDDGGFLGPITITSNGELLDLPSIDGNDAAMVGPYITLVDPGVETVTTLDLLSIDGSSIPYGIVTLETVIPAPSTPGAPTPTTPAANPVGYPYVSGSSTPPPHPGSDAYGTVTYEVTYATGSGTLPSVGDPVTWTGGGVGTVTSLDSGNNIAGVLTVTYGTGPAPVPADVFTSGGWSSTASAAPVTYSAGADPLPPDPAVTAVLLDRTGVVVGALAEYVSCEWQDVHNDDGNGTIVLPFGHPMIASATPGCQVQCSYYGVPAFTFVVPEGAEIEAVADGEESAQTVTLSGPGRSALLERAMIYSPKGLAEAFNAQHRLFSFASPDYPYINGFSPTSFEHIEWHGRSNPDPITGVGTTRWMTNVEYTTVLRSEDDVIENIWWPAPLEWPVPQAVWIWGQEESEVVGRNYFWRQFRITAESNVGIFATGDNSWTLYLDGLPIIGEDRYDHTWAEYKVVETKLPAGVYTLAAVVENWEWPPQYDNPGAFLCAVAPLSSAGETIPAELQQATRVDVPPTEPTREGKDAVDAAVHVLSDSSWKSLAYPLEEPGWSAGDIMRNLVAEAQARSALDSWVASWNESDSAGDEWPLMAGFSAPIGSSVRDLLRSLVDQGVVDWKVLPGDMVLQMFNQSPTGVTTATAFAVTGDISTQEIVSQSFTPQNAPVTRMLVKWSAGYFEVEAPAEAAVWGWQEGFVSIDAATQPEAQRRAQVLLDSVKDPHWAVVVEVDPLEANRPYFAYGKGDRITVPNENGVPTPYRVMSVSVVADDQGRAGVVLELDSQLLTRFRDEENLIRLLGTAVVGNTKVRNALATTSAVAR